MNKITVYLMLFSFFLLCMSVAYYSARGYIRERRKRLGLEKALENQKKNLVYIVRHAQELAEIGRNKSKVDAELSEAKTDEEVVDIINSIIDANNDRVRNDAKS